MKEIKDTGTRTEFDSGAVRECCEGKGRCDLLPIGVVDDIVEYHDTKDVCNDDFFIPLMANFGCELEVGIENCTELVEAFVNFSLYAFDDIHSALLEVSKQFEEGSKKYSENNWMKGIPLHCYIDSAIRHYLKYKRGDSDEPHDRAVLWNLMCAIWTIENKPELIDVGGDDAKK